MTKMTYNPKLSEHLISYFAKYEIEVFALANNVILIQPLSHRFNIAAFLRGFQIMRFKENSCR